MNGAKVILKHGMWSLLSLFMMATFFLGIGYIYLESQLPDVDTLKTVRFQVPLRIFTNDNKLIAEFGEKRRQPVTLEQIPKPLIDAVLATEDQRFFEHPGVDLFGLLRAVKQLVVTGVKGQGGSTITMQVARNFYLSPEKTYLRKVKELLLAIKIDHVLSKEKILELYFNKIFFGNRAYGIAAAAQVYYGKQLSELTLPQMAMLAGLPKAPSTINPIINPEAALRRRNHVLGRMLELGYIDQKTYDESIKAPLTAKYHALTIDVRAPYVSEMVRDALVKYFGSDVYTDGLNVYTTIQSETQLAANRAVRKALLEYDQRHGYRGPEEKLGLAPTSEEGMRGWLSKLNATPTVSLLEPGIVMSVDAREAGILLKSGETIAVLWEGMKWARPYRDNKKWSPAPKSAQAIVQVGDRVRVVQNEDKTWSLAQLPEVEGALIALEPHSGAIKALVGGFDYNKSKFNRATQATRQPGSAFKPFIYAAALAKGYTLATLINDAPIVIHDTGDETLWRPQNVNGRFYGPTRLRVGLTRSRNLVSIRLLDSIGVPYAQEYLKNFGFDPSKLPTGLSLALGSGVVTPIDLATGYAVFANGGYLVTPHLIARVSNVSNKLIYQAQVRVACEACVMADYHILPAEANNLLPHKIDTSIAFLMTSALKDVIQAGTGRMAKKLNRQDLAGKTGTTNNQLDAWFSGYNGDLVAIAWVGFDQPRSLHEYGAEAALPMWIYFMDEALRGRPEHSLAEPPDIVTARIDPATGLLAWPEQNDAVFENFRSENVPKRRVSLEEHQEQAPQGVTTEHEYEPLF